MCLGLFDRDVIALLQRACASAVITGCLGVAAVVKMKLALIVCHQRNSLENSS